jgi:hypothetical protein
VLVGLVAPVSADVLVGLVAPVSADVGGGSLLISSAQENVDGPVTLPLHRGTTVGGQTG